MHRMTKNAMLFVKAAANAEEQGRESRTLAYAKEDWQKFAEVSYREFDTAITFYYAALQCMRRAV
jgi:hypothetical protein